MNLKRTIGYFISTLFLFYSISVKADFGIYASAVRINNDWYNGSGSGTSLINSTTGYNFNNYNYNIELGTIYQNSGTLILNGGQVKTFKDNGGNVCGGFLNYRIYENGTTPPSNFSTISLGYLCDCSSNVFSCAFNSPCISGNQIWSNDSYGFDLTNRCPGNYTIEVYFDITGEATYNGCNDRRYDSNNNANYKAYFTITSNLNVSTSDITLCEGLPLNLNSTVTGGDSTSYTYSWSGPSSFTSTDANPFVNNSAQSMHAGTYSLQVTDGCGFTSSASTLNVTVNPLPTTNPINPL